MSVTASHDLLKRLMGVKQKPCISLFQPTHRSYPEREQDPIRFRHLVRQLETDLEQFGTENRRALLAPFQALLDDKEFWNTATPGLAIFAAPGFFEVARLAHPLPALVVVNERMHVKPLLHLAQAADRYQVLALTRDAVRLYEGSRDELCEIPLAEGVPARMEDALGQQVTEKGHSGFSQGHARGALHHESGGAGKQGEIERDRERYFREVDRSILEQHSRPSGLPLILAALPENQALFRQLSHNPMLAEGIDKDPGLLSLDELRAASWAVIEPRYLKRLEDLSAQFGLSQGQGLATDRIEEIGHSIMQGRVATLLVEAERQIPGQTDASAGLAQPVSAEQATTPDLLDELSVWTFEHGGEVVVVPSERMPTRSGAAALYRY